MIKKDQMSRGQVILIILLVTTIGLTIGLSLVSRTINDVKISSQIAESQKAFSAAEAGIEAALKGAATGGNLSLTGATADYNVSDYGGGNVAFSIPNIAAGDSKTVWFINHNDDGSIPANPSKVYTSDTIDICWGNSADSTALELTLFYLDAGITPTIAKAVYDPTGTISSPTPGGSDLCGHGSLSQAVNDLSIQSVFGANLASSSDNAIFLRVTPLFQASDVIVQGGSMPKQGKQISSTGQTGTGVARKINVLQGYSSLPPVFDYTLFTNN